MGRRAAETCPGGGDEDKHRDRRALEAAREELRGVVRREVDERGAEALFPRVLRHVAREAHRRAPLRRKQHQHLPALAIGRLPRRTSREGGAH